MPFPKSWDAKPKADAYPYKVNSNRLCHNCQQGYPSESLAVFSGLCPKCVEINEDKFPTTSGGSNKCIRCETLPNTNFGIYRGKCQSCSSSHALIQRCMSCDMFKKNCWNHICCRCRFGKYLCENTGEYFGDEENHFRWCWCLPYEDRCSRQQNSK